MGDDMPMWKGLFEWSMSYQDGTAPTGSSNARPLSEADRQWLEDALKGAMLDLSNRMQDISLALNEPDTETTTNSTTPISTTPLEDKERMLDELMEIVESIDQAKDLSTIGGLQTLLNLLSSPHESLRWRAAEVIATCVQNNPEVQDAFFQGGALLALWPLLEYDGGAADVGAADGAATTASSSVCLVKAMLAISCQIRGHPASLQWLREHDGLKKIISILSKNTLQQQQGNGSSSSGESGEIESADAVRVQRKCLQMLGYLLNTVPSDRISAITTNTSTTTTTTTTDGGALLPLLVYLISGSDDGDIRSAALGVIQQLSRDDTCLVELQKESCGVVAAVQAVQCKLDALPKEEWGPAEEEAKLAVAVMGDLVRKVDPLAGSGDGSGNDNTVAAERSVSMQLMALPDQQEQE